MGTVSERLAFLITANADSAIKAFEATGRAADKELGRAENRIDRVGVQMSRFGAGALAATGVAAVGLYDLADSAGDAAEATSKANVIFGDGAGAVLEYGQNAAKAAGLSKTEALNAASTFGTMGKAAGLAGDDLAGFSVDLVGLSADLASFSNTSPEQAIEAIGAALRGESEPIRAYGVLLNDATLKQRAMTLGLYDGTGALDQQTKVLAAQAEIYAQTTDAQGDFARTSDGLANQQKILAAEFENLKISIGEGVLPVATQLVSVAGDVAGAFNGLDPTVKSGIGSFAAYGTAALGIVGSLSFAGGQALKFRDNLTTVADDGTRSLNGLGKAAKGAGLALAAMAAVDVASGAINDLFDVADKQADSFRELSILLDQYQNGTASATDATAGFTAAVDSVDDELRGFLGLGGVVDNFWNEQITLIDGTEASLGTYRDAFDKVMQTSSEQGRQVIEVLQAQRDSLEDGSSMAAGYDKVIAELQKRYDLLSGSADAVTKANSGAAGSLADVGDEAQQTAKDVRTLEERFADYYGLLDDSDALLNARDQFADLREAIEDAKDTSGKSADEIAQDQRDVQKEVNDTKREVIDYAAEVGGIPDEAITNILALIDQGKLDEAYAEFERLTKPRQAVIDIVTRGGGRDEYDAAATAGRNNQPTTARAHGGPVEAGEGYMVGEAGREYFQPGQDGYVYPASKIKDAPPATVGAAVDIEALAMRVADRIADRLSTAVATSAGDTYNYIAAEVDAAGALNERFVIAGGLVA